jgi:2,4-dienoyl-CoA reductase (NADPH2)
VKIVLLYIKNGEEKVIPCDTILICAGQEKENSLAKEFSDKYPEKKIFVIGGAKDASGIDAKRAILDGNLAAREIGQKG